MEKKSLIILAAVIAVAVVAGTCIIAFNNNPAGDGNKTANVEASAGTDGYAAISDNIIADSVKGETESLEIKVSGDNAVGIRLGAASVKVLSESKSAITVSMNNGSMTLDNTVLKSLDKGKDMVLSLSTIGVDDLNPKQAIAAEGCSTILSADLTQDSTPVHGLNGKATMSSTYVLKDGEDAKKIHVAYIDENGSMEIVTSGYAENTITVTAEHLSVFVVFFEDITERTFTVTFNSNGGSSVGEKTVRYGETVSKPSDPTKESTALYDYSFAGWFIDSELKEPYDFSKPVYYDIELYASWDVELKKSVASIAKAFAESYDGLFQTFTYDESSTESKASVSCEFDTETTKHGVFKHHINFILTEDDEMFKNGKDLIDASNHKRMRIEKEMVDTGSDNIYACVYQRVHQGSERAMLLFAMYEDNVYVESNLEVYGEDFLLSPASLVTQEDIMKVFDVIHDCIQQFKNNESA